MKQELARQAWAHHRKTKKATTIIGLVMALILILGAFYYHSYVLAFLGVTTGVLHTLAHMEK